MTRASVPVDLFNPGQVFACLGLAEAAAVLLGETRGAFDWRDAGQAWFHVEAPGEDPVQTVLRFLQEAAVVSWSHDGAMDTSKWSIETRIDRTDDTFSIQPPTSPATLPALLYRDDQALRYDHWGDATRRDNVKFWAGAGGYPGAGLLKDALELVRERIPTCAVDPLNLDAPQSSSFRLDWRRDYVPLEIGFSLNVHTSITTRGYPLVEVLGAYGLGHARPRRHKSKLDYSYGVVGASDDALLPLPLLRAALGVTPTLPFPQRQFRMTLDWPGQENQARCITSVFEETHR